MTLGLSFILFPFFPIFLSLVSIRLIKNKQKIKQKKTRFLWFVSFKFRSFFLSLSLSPYLSVSFLKSFCWSVIYFLLFFMWLEKNYILLNSDKLLRTKIDLLFVLFFFSFCLNKFSVSKKMAINLQKFIMFSLVFIVVVCVVYPWIP